MKSLPMVSTAIERDHATGKTKLSKGADKSEPGAPQHRTFCTSLKILCTNHLNIFMVPEDFSALPSTQPHAEVLKLVLT